MTLTREKIAEALNKQVGLSRNEASDLVDAFFEEIRTTLAGNEHVKFSGFGNFQLREKKSRPGRNPSTGEDHIIVARRVVTFHPSGKLKNIVLKNHQP